MSRQFDVHVVVSGGSGTPTFLVNLQSDHLDTLGTVVVAPLWPATGRAPAPIHIPVAIDGRRYLLAVNEIAFVRVSTLGRAIANIGAERDRIVRALDLLFTGV